MRNVYTGPPVIPTHCRQCPECMQVFDLISEQQAAEWYYGHDCEPID